MEVTHGPSPIFIEVRDISHVGEARRRALTISRFCGLGEVQTGNVSIIVTELANNLLRHATDGHLVLQWILTEWGTAFEVLSIDRGPGMKNVGRCMEDGYTTGGTPGNGLGAVRRLSSEFDIYSIPSQGTVAVSRVRANNGMTRASESFVRWGAYCRPAPGETVSGDTWRAASSPSSAKFLVADGLGHGPAAAQASEAVATAFEENPAFAPDQFLDAAHRKANGTRGAAAAVAELEPGGRVRYAGIGNISGRLVAGENSRSMVSHNGTVGVTVRKSQVFDYAMPPDGVLVMNSDGLQSRWTFEAYPGLQVCHPTTIAAVLARDFNRGRDDLTVLVAKSTFSSGQKYG